MVIRRRDVWLERVCSQLLMSWRQGWRGIISSLYLTNAHPVIYPSDRRRATEAEKQWECFLRRVEKKNRYEVKIRWRFQHISIFHLPEVVLSVVVYTISSQQLLFTSHLLFCWCAKHQTIDQSVSAQWPQRAKVSGGRRTAVLAEKPQNTCAVIKTLLLSQVLMLAGTGLLK